MIIRADYCLIDARLCDLARIVRSIDKEIEYLQEVIDNLGIFWESDAGGEYAIRITTDLLIVEALARKAGFTIQAIRGAIQKFDDAEMRVGELITQI